MCFSPTVSFVTSGALGAIGSQTLKKVKKNSEIPLAAIPLIFGVQQLSEGIVWISFNSLLINTIATYVYSFFTTVFWPFFIPFSVYLIETQKTNKKILFGFMLLGSVTSLYFLLNLFINPITSEIVGNSISYNFGNVVSFTVGLAYVLSVNLSLLFSSHTWVKILGVAFALSLLISYVAFTETAYSVWCFFAAILSGFVYFHFRKSRATIMN